MTNKARNELLDGNLPYRLGQISAELQNAKEALRENKSRLDDLATRLSAAETKLRSLNRWKLGFAVVLLLTILVFIFNVPLKNAVEWLANYRGQ